MPRVRHATGHDRALVEHALLTIRCSEYIAKENAFVNLEAAAAQRLVSEIDGRGFWR